MDSDFNRILHDARKARNKIVHSVSQRLTGCIETNFYYDESTFLDEISRLSKEIIEGDALVSLLISIVSKEPLPRYDYISEHYKRKFLQWVMEL